MGHGYGLQRLDTRMCPHSLWQPQLEQGWLALLVSIACFHAEGMLELLLFQLIPLQCSCTQLLGLHLERCCGVPLIVNLAWFLLHVL